MSVILAAIDFNCFVSVKISQVIIMPLRVCSFKTAVRTPSHPWRELRIVCFYATGLLLKYLFDVKLFYLEL